MFQKQFSEKMVFWKRKGQRKKTPGLKLTTQKARPPTNIVFQKKVAVQKLKEMGIKVELGEKKRGGKPLEIQILGDLKRYGNFLKAVKGLGEVTDYKVLGKDIRGVTLNTGKKLKVDASGGFTSIKEVKEF